MKEIESLSRLSLKEKIGQLFMIGFRGTELPDNVKKFITDNNIGFVILFSRNIESTAQITDLTNHIHTLAKSSPFIYTDQEGGTVVQFKEIAATFTSHMGIAATGQPKNAEISGRIIGEEMSSCGIDGVLAPVLDVNIEENNPIIGIRSFSDNPGIVINYAKKFYQGLNKGGVAACGKHYPGHGSTTEDSHQKIPVLSISRENFYKNALLPFFELAKLNIDYIMIGHVLYPEISNKIAPFSKHLVSDLLRRERQYNGVILSDCMEMSAIRDNFSSHEIVKHSIEAGIDVIIASHTLDFQKELIDHLTFLVKKVTIPEKRIDQSVSRIIHLKKQFNLVNKRKFNDPGKAEKIVGNNKPIEEKIANRSITILRNRMGLIPVNIEKKCLILEWEKSRATIPISQAENISFMENAARKCFKNLDIQILKLNEKIPEGLIKKLSNYTYVIAGVFSRNPEIEKIQSIGVKKIAKLRKDTIVVALGNPYDIRNFSFINTYITTYGFRNVQMDALFKIITGQMRPCGKLPVKIGNLFKRGEGISM